MQFSKVAGKRANHKVTLYTLSTCVWCKMTKQFLVDNDVEYEFVDVDLLEDDERNKARQSIAGKGATLSYPTIVVDEKTVITGFKKDQLKEVLGV